MAVRRKFKAHGSNPLKIYKRRYTDAQVTAFAQERRRERLSQPTSAERRFAELLRECNITVFERESIFLNGDRHIAIDFLVKTGAGIIAFEIDGLQHRYQTKYDAGRDRWMLETHGIRTIRIKNEAILQKPDEVRKLIESEVYLK